MSATYGGVPLSCSFPPDLGAIIEQRIPPLAVYEFEDWCAPWKRHPCLTWRGYVPNLHRPVKVGHLFWPVGAARWAVGHFAVSDNQLSQIRALAFAAPGYVPLPLVLAGRATLTTNLYMLPARPLARITGTNGYHLLTLVDQRYFWWFQETGSMEAETTWTGLFSALASILGISLTVDTISAAYGTPSQTLVASYDYVPDLLDAAAYNCGMRVVRHYDGTVECQRAATALTNENTQMADGTPILMGGRMALP